MISVGLEGLVRESSLGCGGIVEGLGSVHYVGLGRAGLPGIFGSEAWPSTWHQGPGKWQVIGDRPRWPQKLVRV